MHAEVPEAEFGAELHSWSVPHIDDVRREGMPETFLLPEADLSLIGDLQDCQLGADPSGARLFHEPVA